MSCAELILVRAGCQRHQALAAVAVARGIAAALGEKNNETSKALLAQLT